MQKLLPLTDFDDHPRAEGLPFDSEYAARWGFRKSAEHGTADAFVRIGRRVYIDPDKFHELVRQGQAA